MRPVFVDTNILLHYPPLREIDWCRFSDSPAVELVICIPVVQELDRRKADARLGTRARARIKEIQEGKGTEIRPGVTLRIFDVPIRKDDFPDTLSFDEGDARIVHCAMLYQSRENDKVFVATEDLGMTLRCEGHQLTPLKLPDNLRLPDAQSEERKRIRELEAEIREISNKLPKLRIYCSPSPDHVHELSQPELPEIDEAKVLRLRKAYQWRQSAITSALDAYTKGVRQRFELNNEITDENARTVNFALKLVNEGAAPAREITVAVNFPREVIKAIVFDSWLDGERAKPPMGHAANKHLPAAVDTVPMLANLYRNPYALLERGVLKKQILLLAHDDEVPIGSFWTTFASWEVVQPFELTGKIHALDPPLAETFRVPVRVRRSD